MKTFSHPEGIAWRNFVFPPVVREKENVNGGQRRYYKVMAVIEDRGAPYLLTLKALFTDGRTSDHSIWGWVNGNTSFWEGIPDKQTVLKIGRGE